MKRFLLSAIALLLLAGCSQKSLVKSDHPTEPIEKPSTFCRVINPPNPLLLGTWEGSFLRSKSGKDDQNFVRYKVIKYGDKYAVHQYRVWKKGRKKKVGWLSWVIDGDEIIGQPERFGVRLFVEGGAVYYTIRGLTEPVRMIRVSD